MDAKKSLSPAQIQFLKIGPKSINCESSKKNIHDALVDQHRSSYEQTNVSSALNKIPKLTYGEFQKTVNNFGLLLNKNFGNETTLHQVQKFGPIAKTINTIMLNEKDRPVYNQKKNALMKKLKDRSDNRTFLKSIYNYQGEKLHVTLKSFNIEQSNGHKTMDGLPIPYLRFLVLHVNSARLSKIIQGAIKNEGSLIVVEFQKIQGRASHFSNGEVKYQNIPYSFERMGQQLTVTLPHLEIVHTQSGYQQIFYIQNKEILETLEANFDNIEELLNKYLDFNKLDYAINPNLNKYQENQAIQQNEEGEGRPETPTQHKHRRNQQQEEEREEQEQEEREEMMQPVHNADDDNEQRLDNS